jgi:hypothetical protein
MRSAKWIVCSLALFLTHTCFAVDTVEIVKSEGSVTVSKTEDDKPQTAAPHGRLPSVNVLSTGENGRAVVRVGNAGYIVLGKSSQIEIDNSGGITGFFRHVTGMAYFAFNTIKGKERPIEVKTRIYTIGIRGTRFLVTDMPDRNAIGMRKGAVSVSSLSEEGFEIHKRATVEGVAAMKAEAQAAMNKERTAFETYKENVQQDFVEYKRELQLGADRMLSFDGNRADEQPLDVTTKNDLESLESYAGAWINKVRD